MDKDKLFPKQIIMSTMPTPSNFLYGGAFKSNYKSLFEDYIKNASPEQRKLWEALKNGNWNVIEEKE